MQKMDSPDGKCPACQKIVKGALPRKIFKCPDDGTDLLTMNEGAVEAIIKSAKVPEWVEMITGIPKPEIHANMTLNQIRHFAGLFWRQNFSDEGMPEASRENFKRLLGMIGKGEKEPAPAPTETKQSQPQA